MKLFVTTLLSFSAIVCQAATEWHVSQEPTYKQVLVEEFTGIHCGHCPQAHVITNNMLTARPDQVNIIAIHAGSFAEPYAGIEPDFRTADGSYLNDTFGINSYPSGMVNRTPWDSESEDPVTSRSLWADIARQQNRQEALVNLWASANYEGSERLFTVEVEGYLSQTLTDRDDLRLAIAITQNNITGPQNGATEGNQYLHQHMLRQFITAPSGDLLPEIDENNRFRATYTCEIPENWNEVKADPRNLVPVIFVSQGTKGEILNSLSVIPTYENYQPRASYQLADYKIPMDGNSYGYNTLDIYFRNLSAGEVTDLEFEIVTPQGSTTSQLSDLQIMPMHSQYLQVPCDGLLAHTSGQAAINLLTVNGAAASATPLQIEIDDLPVLPTQLTIAIRTDNHASDNTWTILDSDRQIIKKFGPYSDDLVTEISEEITLTDGQIYCLEVTDNWGDGILDPRGTVKVYDTEGNLQAQNLQIQNHGTRIFFMADSAQDPAAIETIENSSASGPAEYYSITGQKLGTCRPAPDSGIIIKRQGGKTTLLLP